MSTLEKSLQLAPPPLLLSQTLAAAGVGLLWFDTPTDTATDTLRYANETVLRWLGQTPSRRLNALFELSAAQTAALRAPQRPGQTHQLLLKASRQVLEASVHRLQLDGRPLLALRLSRAEQRFESDAIEALQREVLEAIALGWAFRVVMDLLCRRVEAIAPELVCTVLEVDAEQRLRPVAAPSIPVAYGQALDGLPIGPQAGSCGTAAWRGEPVEVQDIGSDPLWQDYAQLALQYGLAACWSSPIFVHADRVGATFALYYRTPRAVEPFHRQMVEACVQLCQVALKHEYHRRQIERLAYYDGVTGLPNRTLFAERARALLQTAGQQGTQVALLLLDMDRFKTINDSLGHAAGDQVLAELALRLGAALRPVDTLARLGGDEFIALLPGSDAQDALRVAALLHQSLHAPLPMPAHVDLRLRASIGISVFPDDGNDLDSLLKNADIAMYAAKRAGRNCSHCFMRSMNQALDERLHIEGALRAALQAQTLSLHYQPKFDMQGDGRIVGVEALLRWHDAELGQVAPDVFIDVAEECGLINALDSWVLDTACQQLAHWAAAGVAVPSVAVNASALRFYQDDVAAQVSSLLARHGLRAGQLTLEVTERLMLDDNLHAAEQLRRLHAMGVRLSVDDFGTGYSSLGYLKRLPVLELKLDKSFVSDLETDAGSRALAIAVIGIGHALGLTVVAEGVETEGQRRLLQQAGCDVAQGYWYARPQPVAAFEAWLKQR